jgi:hypothetical protein
VIPRIVIATPLDCSSVESGSVNAGYAWTLAETMRLYGQTVLFPNPLMFNADIERARNRAAAKVLRDMPDATHILWWDSDTFPRDLGLLKAMVETGEDVVGAPYTRKALPVRSVHRELDGMASGQCLYARDIGFGYTLTSVRALRLMASFFEEETYTDWTEADGEQKIVGLFNLRYELVDGRRIRLSEDRSFCSRWRETGGNVALYCGPGNMIAHVGQCVYQLEAK